MTLLSIFITDIHDLPTKSPSTTKITPHFNIVTTLPRTPSIPFPFLIFTLNSRCKKREICSLLPSPSLSFQRDWCDSANEHRYNSSQAWLGTDLGKGGKAFVWFLWRGIHLKRKWMVFQWSFFKGSINVINLRGCELNNPIVFYWLNQHKDSPNAKFL